MSNTELPANLAHLSEATDTVGEERPSTSGLGPNAESTPQTTRNVRHISITMDSTGAQPPFEPTSQNAQAPLGPETQLENMFAKMSEAIVNAMRQSTTLQTTAPRAAPLPEFRGMEHESAQTFVEQMEDYFRRNRITDYSLRLALITDQLKGDARRWYEPYRFLINRYVTFVDRLIAKYDSTESLTQVTTKLYGDRQQAGESTAVFITRKMCLFNRVDPAKAEYLKTAIILDQLRPELRSRLRGHGFRTLEELVTVASQIESDLRDVTPMNTAPSTTERRQQEPFGNNNRTRTGNSPPATQINRQGPSTPCRYCPGTHWHFHSECPNNPYRNRQGNSVREATSSRSNNEPQWRNAETSYRTNQTSRSGGRARDSRGALLRTAEVTEEPSSEENPENRSQTEETNRRPSSVAAHPPAAVNL